MTWCHKEARALWARALGCARVIHVCLLGARVQQLLPVMHLNPAENHSCHGNSRSMSLQSHGTMFSQLL